MRPTWQELDEIIHDIGVKKLALELGVSASLIYKWCQEPKSESSPDASGAANPLDRLFTIISLAADDRIVSYVARRCGGFFIHNPSFKSGAHRTFVSETIAILDKFADLMRLAERSLSNDGNIDKEEATDLRRDWDKLKSRLESFIVACENGDFNHPDT